MSSFRMGMYMCFPVFTFMSVIFIMSNWLNTVMT